MQRCKSLLAGVQFGIGIFDESHNVRRSHTQQFDCLMNLDCPYRVQFTGTPIYHSPRDWIVQTRWLQANIDPAVRKRYGASAMQAAYDRARTVSATDAYNSLRNCT